MKFLNKLTKPALLAAFLLFAFGTSCTHNPQGLDTAKDVCFETQILPIFQTNCAISGCHVGGGGEEEEFSLADYNSIMKYITPNSLDKSEIYQAITSSWENLMPPQPRSPLTVDLRKLIALWIQQGAKNVPCQ